MDKNDFGFQFVRWTEDNQSRIYWERMTTYKIMNSNHVKQSSTIRLRTIDIWHQNNMDNDNMAVARST